MISSLSFWAPDCDSVEDCVPVVTEIASLRPSGLSRVEVYLGEKSSLILWNESPDFNHQDRGSLFWSNGAFFPMCRSLVRLASRMEWPKDLKYNLQKDFCKYVVRDGKGWTEIRALEGLVKKPFKKED